MSVDNECTARCAEMPRCETCGLSKKPRGRDSRDNGLCDHECPGYDQAPLPGHLWWSEWRDHVAGDHSGCTHDDATTRNEGDARR